MTHKAQLLIVEDDLDLADMISSYFRAQNYDVHCAAWGSEAEKLADTQHLDLIVLDISLPDTDGFSLCRRLREHPRTAETPIVFLSEKRDRVDKLQGLELGVVDYITKPFDIQELRLRVRNAINRARAPIANHPVTNLPEGKPVDERINALPTHEEDWTALTFAIEGLGAYRERYGSLAGDDVLRASALMSANPTRDLHGDASFVGHLEATRFLVISSPEQAAELQKRVENRVSQSREFFFPPKDREANAELPEIRLSCQQVKKAEGPFSDGAAIRAALEASASASASTTP